jgi:uncharacterized membrane-anchored protein
VVVIARMANLGDFVARTLKLGYGWVSVTDGLLVATFLFATRPRAWSSASAGVDTGAEKLLPVTNMRYWLALLAVSVTGTNGGDFFSTDTGLGFARASLVLGVVLALAVAIEVRARTASEARYWMVIGVIRTSGTVMGDLLSNGLHMGFAVGATLAATLLLLILLVPWPTIGRLVTASGATGRTRSRAAVEDSAA